MPWRGHLIHGNKVEPRGLGEIWLLNMASQWKLPGSTSLSASFSNSQAFKSCKDGKHCRRLHVKKDRLYETAGLKIAKRLATDPSLAVPSSIVDNVQVNLSASQHSS